MASRDAEIWMWADACAVLARADRMQRQFFQLQQSNVRAPAWEPPVDVLETAQEVLVFVALPGVDVDRVEAVIEDGHLLIGGVRMLPRELQNAVIHRIELPQGRFERRVPLPAGRYSDVRRSSLDGCLLISLHKAA